MDIRPWWLRQPNRVTWEQVHTQGALELSTDAMGYWAVPKGVEAGRGEMHAMQVARTAPGRDARARDGVNGQSPKGALEVVGERHTPDGRQGCTEGRTVGRGGSRHAESHGDELVMQPGAPCCSGRVDDGRERSDRDGGSGGDQGLNE